MTAIFLTVLLGGVGTFLLLPHRLGKTRSGAWRAAGGVLTGLALIGLATIWLPPPTFLAGLFFYGFALLALVGALLMITSRNPVYSALWFAMVVLSTSGLFLLAGAQFLAAGTIIVYAGAIIVTFLFVIMLAQSEGSALYDRLARAPGRSVVVVFAMLAGLIFAILAPAIPPEGEPPLAADEIPLLRTTDLLARVDPNLAPGPHRVLARAVTDQNRMLPDSSAQAANGFPSPRMAALGAILYTDHLVTVEVAGAILFIALVGAASIATPRPQIRPVPGEAVTPH